MASRLSVSDDLKNLDYKDSCTAWLDAGKYSYTLKIKGGGKVAFKLKHRTYPGLTESGKAKWHLLESKQKVDSGSKLTGTVRIAKSFADAESSDIGEVKLIFQREFASKGAEYEFSMEKIGG